MEKFELKYMARSCRNGARLQRALAIFEVAFSSNLPVFQTQKCHATYAFSSFLSNAAKSFTKQPTISCLHAYMFVSDPCPSGRVKIQHCRDGAMWGKISVTCHAAPDCWSQFLFNKDEIPLLHTEFLRGCSWGWPWQALAGCGSFRQDLWTYNPNGLIITRVRRH